MTNKKGWRGESQRHSVSRKGIKTIKNVPHKEDITNTCFSCNLDYNDDNIHISDGKGAICLSCLITQWNKGKMPRTRYEWKKILELTNYELSSGWWANRPELVEELRSIKYFAEKILKENKLFHEHYNVGSTKYIVDFHDGIKTYPDGSEFYDMRMFKNKKDFEKFKNELIKQGYMEESNPLYRSD